MSYFDDIGFDPFGDDEQETEVACKYCGCTGLEWVEVERGWRLFDADGDMHQCNRNDDPARAFAPVKK